MTETLPGLWPEPLAEPVTPPPPMQRHTEQTMIDRLIRRYSRTVQNGDWIGHKWMWATQVPNRSMMSYGTPLRRADFVAIDTASADHLQMDVFEVKVSRADFRTELRDPEKPEAFRRYAKRFWYVVPDKAIVGADLPPWAGLLVAQGPELLRVARNPSINGAPDPMPTDMVTMVMRAIQSTAIEHGGSDCDCGPARRARQLLTTGVDRGSLDLPG